MMRTILILMLLFTMLNFGHAQEMGVDTSKVRHELGINASSFFLQFFKSESQQLNQSPYLFTYRAYFPKWTFRFGVGINMNRDKLREEGFDDSEINLYLNANARLGLEWGKYFGKRWKGTLGIDVVLQYWVDDTIVDSGFDKVTTNTTTIGGGLGPIMGLHYYITPDLSLYTEGALYYVLTKQTTSREFENIPQFDDEKETIDRQRINTILPASIFLLYRF